MTKRKYIKYSTYALGKRDFLTLTGEQMKPGGNSITMTNYKSDILCNSLTVCSPEAPPEIPRKNKRRKKYLIFNYKIIL